MRPPSGEISPAVTSRLRTGSRLMGSSTNGASETSVPGVWGAGFPKTSEPPLRSFVTMESSGRFDTAETARQIAEVLWNFRRVIEEGRRAIGSASFGRL